MFIGVFESILVQYNESVSCSFYYSGWYEYFTLYFDYYNNVNSYTFYLIVFVEIFDVTNDGMNNKELQNKKKNETKQNNFICQMNIELQ